MGHVISRRRFAAAGMTALAGLRFPSVARAADRTLRFIPQADLRVLDPVWTTAYVTRNHGYMVFDTLFALDDKMQPQPQMVGRYDVSDDKLRYSFLLRDGLKFHDGQPVRGIDCTVSLRRWMARDSFGQIVAREIAEMSGGEDKTFSIRLKAPFPLLIEAIAKVSSLVPFIMPERLAKTDPYRQITEIVGSGPFKFVAAEFEPGNKVVYIKNPDYQPRSEPPSWAAGGKVAKAERVEWLVVPDHATAAAALVSGDVDWWENPPLDLVPSFAGRGVIVADADPLGAPQLVRFNQLWPPFDNAAMRQAILAVTSQAEFMTAIAGDPKNWRLCPSFFTCGSAMGNLAGAEALTGKRDFDKAKQLIAAAGYRGEKIVVLDATDLPGPHAQALVVSDLMTRLGLNVEIAAMDWGQLVTRRASMKPIDQGGWSVFGTSFSGADMLDPILNQPLRSNGERAWFGWPRDDEIETLCHAWVRASELEARQAIAARIQQRAFATVPYIPTGQTIPKTAYRANIRGRIPAPAVFMWNVEKT
jgi:peptide/nickel transport system substrate-binding protein